MTHQPADLSAPVPHGHEFHVAEFPSPQMQAACDRLTNHLAATFDGDRDHPWLDALVALAFTEVRRADRVEVDTSGSAWMRTATEVSPLDVRALDLLDALAEVHRARHESASAWNLLLLRFSRADPGMPGSATQVRGRSVPVPAAVLDDTDTLLALLSGDLPL